MGAPGMQGKLISMQTYLRERRLKMTREKLYSLSKEKLLQELLRYYEDIKRDPFDIESALWGEELMEVISQRALTKDLHELAEKHQTMGPLAAFNLDPNAKKGPLQ